MPQVAEASKEALWDVTKLVRKLRRGHTRSLSKSDIQHSVTQADVKSSYLCDYLCQEHSMTVLHLLHGGIRTGLDFFTI